MYLLIANTKIRCETVDENVNLPEAREHDLTFDVYVGLDGLLTSMISQKQGNMISHSTHN